MAVYLPLNRSTFRYSGSSHGSGGGGMSSSQREDSDVPVGELGREAWWDPVGA